MVGGGINEHYFTSIWFEDFNGMPQGVWFLLCLFWVNIIAYIVTIIAKKSGYEIAVFSALCFLLGFVGFMFGQHEVNVPLYIDSALTAIPFFCFGRILCQYTKVLNTDTRHHINIVLAIACLLITYLIAYGKVNYRENNYQMIFPVVLISGIAGTLGVLFFSKWLRWLPIVSYMGRYSIIVLCTHQLIIMPLHLACTKYEIHGLQEGLIVWTVTSFACYLLIEPMRRLLPYVTAQKDAIKYKPKYNNNT